METKRQSPSRKQMKKRLICGAYKKESSIDDTGGEGFKTDKNFVSLGNPLLRKGYFCGDARGL